MIRRKFATLILILTVTVGAASQNGGKISREEYINNFSDLAMKEMRRTGIPASITLAQGCLESDNGNSTLSVNGNNHFGIKCHDWQGDRMYHDDDERDECFRKYKSAYESFVDHSVFLTTKSRYEFLFDLKPGDYKGWARGLQKAGYATSNKYSALLIKIIEENNLHEYDNMVLNGPRRVGKRESKVKDLLAEESVRSIYMNNRIEYIITDVGDTPDILREELSLYPNEIYRYNDLERGFEMDSGMMIYLQPKRYRAEKEYDTHLFVEGDSMWEISQKYGIRLSRLYKMNNLEENSEPEPGTELNLRKRTGLEIAPLKLKEEEESDVEMEFEFDGF